MAVYTNKGINMTVVAAAKAVATAFNAESVIYTQSQGAKYFNLGDKAQKGLCFGMTCMFFHYEKHNFKMRQNLGQKSLWESAFSLQNDMVGLFDQDNGFDWHEGDMVILSAEAKVLNRFDLKYITGKYWKDVSYATEGPAWMRAMHGYYLLNTPGHAMGVITSPGEYKLFDPNFGFLVFKNSLDFEKGFMGYFSNPTVRKLYKIDGEFYMRAVRVK